MPGWFRCIVFFNLLYSYSITLPHEIHSTAGQKLMDSTGTNTIPEHLSVRKTLHHCIFPHGMKKELPIFTASSTIEAF